MGVVRESRAPPKLPDTTNLVLTKRRNEYNEINAMNVRTKLENKMPPLKNLIDGAH